MMDLMNTMQIRYTHVVPEGTPEIYKDSNVFKPETKPGALDIPKHEDVRGVINRIDLSGIKVNILSTKKGFMRSGDIHKIRQFDILLSGKVELWTLENGKTVKTIINPQTFVVINPHTPHLFNFLEDTVMLEWCDGLFECWYYKPYRDEIDRKFKAITSK